MGLIRENDSNRIIENKSLKDKLSERLAFASSGGKLYKALMNKYQSSKHQERLPDFHRIEQFYREELGHFKQLQEVLKKLGPKDELLPPPSNVNGIAFASWNQILSDPQTSFLQGLEIILQAELINHSGWELLIELAERNEMSELAIQFQQSLNEETFQLITIKQWVQELTLNDEIISPEKNDVLEFDIDSVLKH